MKIMIAGSRGQLGKELIRQFEAERENKLAVIGVDQDSLDICDESAVFGFCRREEPDIIVNCAAYTDVDGCESNERLAFQVNALGARNLAAAAYHGGAKVIQVSTDYVFDGVGDRPKREYDPVHPLSIYGKSKALGEALVQTVNPRHFILRTAWLYGEGRNFVRTILSLALRDGELNIVDDQIGTPTNTKELARCIVALMNTEGYGVYHATCEGSCSWYEFAQKALALAGVVAKINPIKSSQLSRPAPRPQFSVLENFMLNVAKLNTFSPWEDALREYFEEQHANAATAGRGNEGMKMG